MKFYLILLALVLTSCIPASKKALEESNQNILAIAKHQQLQDKAIGITGKAAFGDKFVPVANALDRSSSAIVAQAESTGAKDVGIFNFSAIKNTVVGYIKDGLNVAVDMASSTPYGPLITAGAGIVTTLLGKGALDGVLARRKEKVKKEILKRQHPEDAKKFDDLCKTVETEIKEGKIKV